MRAAYIGAALVVAGAAWWYTRQDASQDAPGEEDAGAEDAAPVDLVESAAQAVDTITGGILKLSAMGRVTGAELDNENVQAFLRVIRRGEGTGDPGGYTRLFGGAQFASMEDHPRQVVTAGRYTSSAAGAYQFITSTWDQTKKVMGLPDFRPHSQDLGAVGLIAARGALDDVKSGRIAQAIAKCAYEWASLPGSPYGQPRISMDTAMAVYKQNGGILEGQA